MSAPPQDTTVGIIGAGPAGLALARLLHLAGVDCVVLERRDRAYIEQRQRAGTLEPATVELLRSIGAAERLDREGLVLDGIELRFAGRGHFLDFAALADGARLAVYPQTKIVQDLVALQTQDGPPLLFEADVHTVSDLDGPRPTIGFRMAGREHSLRCRYIAACDGAYGIGRSTVLAAGGHLQERTYPYSWYGILADVAPSTDTLLYARSDHGFALHSMRSPTVSRLYFQVPVDHEPEQWTDEAIWDELALRLAAGTDWKLERGPITSKAVIAMSSELLAPMKVGRMLLAGDAAHVMPPTGAKGLNLAVADVIALSQALLAAETAETADGEQSLEHYARERVLQARHVERFSRFMTHTMHIAPGEDEETAARRLGVLERIVGSPGTAQLFAREYVGRSRTEAV